MIKKARYWFYAPLCVLVHCVGLALYAAGSACLWVSGALYLRANSIKL